MQEEGGDSMRHVRPQNDRVTNSEESHIYDPVLGSELSNRSDTTCVGWSKYCDEMDPDVVQKWSTCPALEAGARVRDGGDWGATTNQSRMSANLFCFYRP
jgi:hypothetical protein